MPLPPVTPADLLRINDCIPQFPGSKSKNIEIKSSFNPETAIRSHKYSNNPITIHIRLRASVQHTGTPTVAGMYKNCTKEESPEIAI